MFCVSPTLMTAHHRHSHCTYLPSTFATFKMHIEIRMPTNINILCVECVECTLSASSHRFCICYDYTLLVSSFFLSSRTFVHLLLLLLQFVFFSCSIFISCVPLHIVRVANVCASCLRLLSRGLAEVIRVVAVQCLLCSVVIYNTFLTYNFCVYRFFFNVLHCTYSIKHRTVGQYPGALD